MRRKRQPYYFDPEIQPLSDYIFEPTRTWESRNMEDTQPIPILAPPTWSPKKYPEYTDDVICEVKSAMRYPSAISDPELIDEYAFLPDGLNDYILAFLSWETPAIDIITARRALRMRQEKQEQESVETLYDGIIIKEKGNYTSIASPSQHIKEVFDLIDNKDIDIERKLDILEELVPSSEDEPKSDVEPELPPKPEKTPNLPKVETELPPKPKQAPRAHKKRSAPKRKRKRKKR